MVLVVVQHRRLHPSLTLPHAWGQVEMMHNTTLGDDSNLNEYWNNQEVRSDPKPYPLIHSTQ